MYWIIWRHSKGVLWAKDLLKVFYGLNTFKSTSMEGRFKTFYRPKTFSRYFVDRKSYTGVLWTENFLKAEDIQTDSNWWKPFKVLQYNSYLQKVFQRYSVYRKPSKGLLWTEYLLKKYHLMVFYSPKIYWCSSINLPKAFLTYSIDSRPSQDDLLKVFCGPKFS